jgi:hypothetical protein
MKYLMLLITFIIAGCGTEERPTIVSEVSMNICIDRCVSATLGNLGMKATKTLGSASTDSHYQSKDNPLTDAIQYCKVYYTDGCYMAKGPEYFMSNVYNSHGFAGYNTSIGILINKEVK